MNEAYIREVLRECYEDDMVTAGDVHVLGHSGRPGRVYRFKKSDRTPLPSLLPPPDPRNS